MDEQPFSLENLARQDPQYLVQTIKEQRDRIAQMEDFIRQSGMGWWLGDE